MTTALPAAVGTVADAAAVADAATVLHTPCGDGHIVWRRWGDGPPVVLLHGGSGSWNHWVRNIAALVAAGRTVWVPDLPGFGDSARPPRGGDADALPQPVAEGLRQLIGDSAVDLVGFSFGSMVAAFIARDEPARVRRLLVVGAPAFGVHSETAIALRAWRHIPEGPERLAIFRHNLQALMLAGPVDELALALQTANLPRDRLQRRRISRTDVLARTLPLLRCPVQGIWGEHDALYRGRQAELAAAFAAATGGQPLHWVAGAGHWVQYEAAPAFDALMLAALGS